MLKASLKPEGFVTVREIKREVEQKFREIEKQIEELNELKALF